MDCNEQQEVPIPILKRKQEVCIQSVCAEGLTAVVDGFGYDWFESASKATLAVRKKGSEHEPHDAQVHVFSLANCSIADQIPLVIWKHKHNAFQV